MLTAGAPSKDLLERLIYALDAFVENMSSEAILPYMHALMQLLGAVLGGPNVRAHKEALSCLASVVAAAGKAFQPYARACARGRARAWVGGWVGVGFGRAGKVAVCVCVCVVCTHVRACAWTHAHNWVCPKATALD